MVKEKMCLRDLPVLNGDLSWETDTIQARAKTYNPDYDPRDPWTWPQLHSTQHPGYHENRTDPVALPHGIAYPNNIAIKFSRPSQIIMIKHPQHRNNGFGWIRHNNLLFLYTYDGSGHPRAENILPVTERWNWILKVTGTHPEHSEVEAEERPEQPESTTNAFNEVLKTMNETPKKSTADIASLRKEVSQLKGLLAFQPARAGKAERKVKAANKAHDTEASLGREGQAQGYRSGYTGTKENLQWRTAEHDEGCKCEARWAEQVRLFVKESEEKNQKLEAAQKEAATAKEQVMKIWEEMRKAKNSEERKRKDSGEAAEPVMKKARI
ncbi:uncharacterized protein M421DRAFT_91310 [Didymella exigua CBS 183.55]|uniref:Uncharacterized protein n=1 Tax=Didymella exigua CBS 183.55 TaxID=1150837 RepID=A0A6A5RSP7_9PLEO|nr:uncharacterized protein M421DRAFT_91310 [Didymella exigua CBS 183.55]KAF1930134.1 hypothetical protein M421DRAFT_91310 [Didymella exigua CBS 183.55]